MKPSDGEIARAIRKGSSKAFDALFDRYGGPLLGYLSGMVGDRCLAEDLLQETMIRVFQRIGRYEERGAFQSWVFRIATNLALTELRRARLFPVSLDERSWEIPDDGLADAQARLERSELERNLAEGIGTLPEDHRAVILLRVRREMSIREIAETLAIQEGTVKSRIHYAVRKLRAFLARRETPRGKELGNERV